MRTFLRGLTNCNIPLKMRHKSLSEGDTTKVWGGLLKRRGQVGWHPESPFILDSFQVSWGAVESGSRNISSGGVSGTTRCSIPSRWEFWGTLTLDPVCTLQFDSLCGLLLALAQQVVEDVQAVGTPALPIGLCPPRFHMCGGAQVTSRLGTSASSWVMRR